MISPVTPSNESFAAPAATREALLISSDAMAVRTLQQIFGDLSVETSLVGNVAEAVAVIGERRFDAIVIDCDTEGAEEVLRVLRSNSLSRWVIALALASDPEASRAAFRMGVNFTLDKPLSITRTTRLLQTARGMMNIPRRRAPRVRVRCEAHAQIEGGGNFKGYGVDLSEGGIAIQGSTAVPANGRLRISFVLPRTDRSLHVDARVIWADQAGRAGLRFLNLTPSEQATLSRWVSDSPNCDLIDDRRSARR